MSAKPKANEIKITRLYDAPVQAVWDAWTDPAQVAQWWGPRGFTLTTHSKELKKGGHWHYTMHGPDGTDYPNKTFYHEVDEFKRLVYDHGANDDRPPLFRVTVIFAAVGEQTRMEMTMACPTPEAAEQTKKFIKAAGGNSTWDRLGEYLEKTASQNEVFIIARSFDAPIETVFDMWTDPQHFARWLGPDGTTMEFIDAEIAPGKTAFYKMSFASGMTMYGKITYLKIQQPTYLEYTQIFCDAEGELSKHPMVPVWPDTMLTRVIFTEEENNLTRISLIWEPYGDVPKEEMDGFITMRASMTQGWTQAFDKLENLLR